MTFDQLTPAQQQDFQHYDKFMRGMISSLMALHRDADPMIWRQFAEEKIDTLLSQLTGDVPNSTDLAGASDLSVQEFTTLQTILRGLTTTAADNLSTIVKAVGVNA
jgi:hypothetical protein